MMPWRAGVVVLLACVLFVAQAFTISNESTSIKATLLGTTKSSSTFLASSTSSPHSSSGTSSGSPCHSNFSERTVPPPSSSPASSTSSPESRRTCPPLGSPSLDIICRGPTGEQDAVPCDQPQPVGAVASIECRNHFEHRPLPDSAHFSRCGADGMWSKPLFTCTPVCGRPSGKGVAFVRHGRNVSSAADFPWHVVVYDTTFATHEQICGGSLIKPRYFVSGSSVGQGDSGGGLAFPTSERQWFLEGVLSIGDANSVAMSLFTKVSQHTLWMSGAIEEPATDGCGWHEFQCRDGGCIDAYLRCDGRKDCGDGSEEEVCNSPPTVTLPVMGTTTARVQCSEEHGSIMLHLCSGERCSIVWLRGESGDGALWYVTREQCHGFITGLHGWGCSDSKDHGAIGHFFTPSEMLLEVQRRPGELAVWRKGRPDAVAVVPVGENYDTLKVRPFYWSSDMAVQFSVPASACGNAEPVLTKEGNATSVETFPWHIAIYVERSGRKSYTCGGSLVAPCFVVTAASCLPGNATFSVALGKYWSSEDDQKIDHLRVKSFHKHAYFWGSANKNAYDIAVLELENCADSSKEVTPVCLYEGIKPTSKSNVKVAGRANGTTAEQETIGLTQLDFNDCFYKLSTNLAELASLTPDKFCARRRESKP
ncbi:low-density lipoprotein receptor-related protein 8-like isoform X7 [Thrips palmi]|uniref:Low-density lipoprotein receptor-related protein 8-like isoform X7 n=1 Tax=Thrips palmi TaxID=161013 RepID=A0A6P9A5Z7_THRPL|nr:low-density lipoprotein receptor-related protein 8-like isoform X7 [Thrips palmi]